jgi:polysaccharide pyruvyl transferase WcaK-like protein
VSGAETRIGLLEHAGYGNLGDDATVAAVLHHVRLRWPKAQVTGLTLNPSDTRKRHGITSYALRRDCKVPPATLSAEPIPESRLKAALGKYPLLAFLGRAIRAIGYRAPRAVIQETVFFFQSFRVAKSLDLLIICGGGQLRDSAAGPYTFLSTIFKWVLLAKLTGARCYFVNLGAGPLNTRSARIFLRAALSLSDGTSFRDNRSRMLVQRVGFRGATCVHADCVYSLPVPVDKVARRTSRRRRPVVGISPMRVFWETNPDTYSHLISEMAKFSAWLAREQHDLQLFSTEVPSDNEPIGDLKTATTGQFATAPIACPEINGIESLLSKMSTMDYIVTCRFHGVVFAHLMNIPVLAISHHSKVATLMHDIGLSDYCLDINTFDLDQLKDTFTRLVTNAAEVKERMAERAAHYRKELDFQFDSLFPPWDPEKHPRELECACVEVSREH